MASLPASRPEEHPPLRPLAPRASTLPRSVLVLGAVLPLLLLVAWGAWLASRTPPASGPAAIGQPAPDFALTDLDGNPLRLSDLRGRPVMVNFWASWCGPCRQEFPLLRQAVDAHAADGLAVVGVVHQDSAAGARDFLQQMGATWPAAMDPGDRVAEAYAIVGLPETFFIDRNGVVASHQFGPFTASTLQRQLSMILEESPR